MANRLPIDANIVGYWGFDESLESDNAIDEGLSLRHLTVNNASGVAAGRVGNARTFNGTTSYAVPAGGGPFSAFRLQGDLTLICWFYLSSYNAGGSLLRTLVSCGGPTSADNLLYYIGIDQTGRLVYKHDSASGPVIVRTASGVIKINQFYSLAVRRVASGPNQDIEFYVNNQLVPVASVTVNGVGSSLPIPTPLANPLSLFNVGRSLKETDSAFWAGEVDEMSLHNVARAAQPYLKAAYFRITTAVTSSKLTSTNNIQNISSYEMGGGVRWWCFERDGDLYVVREAPLGKFGPETQLTTVGGNNSSLAGKPELIYDVATDTLYVFFVAGNRIYKLTANSTDVPGTVNMPFTADTGAIIKSVDNVEADRFGDGGGDREIVPALDFTYVNRQPVKFTFDDGTYPFGDGGGEYFEYSPGTPNPAFIALTELPSPNGFGVVAGPADSETGGYIIYRVDGNVFTPLANPTLINGVYFSPVSQRVYGRGYIAEALTTKRARSGIYSSMIIDRFGEIEERPGMLVYGRDGDGFDYGMLGDGGGGLEPLASDFTYVNRTPLKLVFQDDDAAMGDGGGQSGSITQAGNTVMI